jgi:hypothetical protein
MIYKALDIILTYFDNMSDQDIIDSFLLIAACD